MAKGSAAMATSGIWGGLIGFGVLGITCGMVILSLISIFPGDNSVDGSGAEYRVNAMLLKIIYTNTSYVFFNGTVADSTLLSSLCTSMFSARNAPGFSNCVLTNLKLFAKYNTSTTNRRRRRAVEVTGGYLTGLVRLFFSTSCEKNSDRLKFASGSSISLCAKQRFTSCNSFMNQTAFQSWTPVPSGLSLSTVDTGFNSSMVNATYQSVGVNQVYLVPLFMSSSYQSSLNFSSTYLTNYTSGCQYIAPISKTSIAAIVSAQSTDTTTTPASG